jgi:hypothetical protein
VVWRDIALWSVVTVGITAGGCTSAPKIEPKGRVVIPLATGADRVPTTAHFLNEVVVELPPIGKPGDQWTIVFNDERFLKQLSPIEPREGGGFAIRFLAVRPGRRPIRFFALPPHGRESTPSQTHEVIVEIE